MRKKGYMNHKIIIKMTFKWEENYLNMILRYTKQTFKRK